ncbi:hypothetical protein AB0K74_49345, partial [Streptomyces sp. NPDC056159]|uniref:hypothetical protein n=1 Tax=Streptomyces sp. NPDC056159 TaxID=3155537 RepID=UPI00342C13D8
RSSVPASAAGSPSVGVASGSEVSPRYAAAVAFSWDGRNSDRRYVNAGTYTWELTGTPADGSGAALKVTGTIKLTKPTKTAADQGTDKSIS